MGKQQDITAAIGLKFKIYFTNWINVVGIAIGTYLFIVITEVFKTGISALPQMLLMALFTVIFYGWIFFAGFLIGMLLFDLILMNNNAKPLRLKLIIEWVLISAPLTYGLIAYSEWLFLAVIVFFFVMQFVRENRILKILE